MPKIKCFLCSKDITNQQKVCSYHNYPEPNKLFKHLDYNKSFKQLVNGYMCSKCAEKDLDLAHRKCLNKNKKEEPVEPVEEVKKLTIWQQLKNKLSNIKL